MPKSPERYQPSEEEKNQAASKMTPDTKRASQEREDVGIDKLLDNHEKKLSP